MLTALPGQRPGELDFQRSDARLVTFSLVLLRKLVRVSVTATSPHQRDTDMNMDMHGRATRAGPSQGRAAGSRERGGRAMGTEREVEGPCREQREERDTDERGHCQMSTAMQRGGCRELPLTHDGSAILIVTVEL